MSYAVVHMQKMKRQALSGMQSHNNRERTPRTNPDVDPKRSHLNYALVPCDNFTKRVNEIIANAPKVKTVRKDAVVYCSFIVTSDSNKMHSMSASEQKQFFKDTVDWFSRTYGADNIVNATVHLDETTPHLHLGLVPITSDGRLSGKDLFNKNSLTKLQTNFARDVGAKYGLERGVEKSTAKHIEMNRYKVLTAKQEIKKVEEKRDFINNEAEAMRIEFVSKRDYIERCRKIAKQMYPEYVKINKHIFGEDTVTLPKEKWEQRFLAQNENKITQNATEQFESTLERFKELSSYKHYEQLKNSLNALQVDYDRLHTQLEISEEKNSKLIKMLKAYNADEDKFYEALNCGLDKLRLTDKQRDKFLDVFYSVRDGVQEQQHEQQYEDISDEWDMEL